MSPQRSAAEMRVIAWFGLSVVAAGCASAPHPVAVAPQSAACAALSDTLSKYISQDALPLAHLMADTRPPAPPAGLSAADTVVVEFLVRYDGTADPASIDIVGSNDPAFRTAVTAFAARSRFAAAQVNGCNVQSRYSLTFTGGPPHS